MLWFKAAGLLILAVIAIFYLFWFFTSNGNSEPEQQTQDLPSANNSASFVSAAQAKPVVSDKWRLAGRLKRDGQAWVVVADTSGRLRIEPASQFSFDGMMMTGEIDGETVTVYSGGIR